MTGGARAARPRRTSRLAEARAAAALPRRRGAGGRSPAKGRRREGCRRPLRGSGTLVCARPGNGESGERVVGDDVEEGYRGGPFGERDASGWSGQSFVRSVPRASWIAPSRKISNEIGISRHRAHLDARGGGACDAAARNLRGGTRSYALGRVSPQIDSAHRREGKWADTESRSTFREKKKRRSKTHHLTKCMTACARSHYSL